MITRHRVKSPLRRVLMPIVTAALLGYFGFHAFSGSYGILAMRQMDEEAQRLKTEFDALKDEHADLDKRVSLLRPESLDADIVDLESRSALNLLRPDEVVISFGAVQHPPQ